MSYSPAVPIESTTYRHYAVSTFSRPQPIRGVSTATPASNSWPLANLAFYVPIYFNEAATVYQVGTGAGGTAGGNFDIGLYSMAGTLIQSTGTQARTANAWNPVNWTDLVIAPGWYYAAMAANGVDTYASVTPAAGLLEAVGVCEEQSAFVLPSTMTPVRTTRAYAPNITFTMRSIAI
jgi:hypothetical protein